MAKNKFEGWVLVFGVLGSLMAVGAIAIAENLVAPNLLFLTEGEFELLAVVFYLFAIILWLAGGTGRMSGRAGYGSVLFLPRKREELDQAYASAHPDEIEA